MNINSFIEVNEKYKKIVDDLNKIINCNKYIIDITKYFDIHGLYICFCPIYKIHNKRYNTLI
jgi:GTP-sensing pleiotropic transcriptional regulator CodY